MTGKNFGGFVTTLLFAGWIVVLPVNSFDEVKLFVLISSVTGPIFGAFSNKVFCVTSVVWVCGIDDKPPTALLSPETPNGISTWLFIPWVVI